LTSQTLPEDEKDSKYSLSRGGILLQDSKKLISEGHLPFKIRGCIIYYQKTGIWQGEGMQEVISSILDIEKKANRILAEASAEKKVLDEKLQAEILKMKQDIDNSVLLKLKKIEEAERAEAEERVLKIRKAAEEKLSAMGGIYLRNKDKWVDTVFNNIVGR
jgi:hypothetical protein